MNLTAGGMTRWEREDEQRRANELCEPDPYYLDDDDRLFPEPLRWERPHVVHLGPEIHWRKNLESTPWKDDHKDLSQWDGEIHWDWFAGDWCESLRIWPEGIHWCWSYTYARGYHRLRFEEGGPLSSKDECAALAIAARNAWHEYLADLQERWGPWAMWRMLGQEATDGATAPCA